MRISYRSRKKPAFIQKHVCVYSKEYISSENGQHPPPPCRYTDRQGGAVRSQRLYTVWFTWSDSSSRTSAPGTRNFCEGGESRGTYLHKIYKYYPDTWRSRTREESISFPLVVILIDDSLYSMAPMHLWGWVWWYRGSSWCRSSC